MNKKLEFFVDNGFFFTVTVNYWNAIIVLK